MRKKIVVFGAGGHGKSLMDVIVRGKKYKVIGIIDKKSNYACQSLIPFIGEEKGLAYFLKKHIKYAAIGIGSIGDIKSRSYVYNLGKKFGFYFPNIIDDSAVISRDIKMGEANFIGKLSVLNANVSIGNACIINTGTVVEHDCVLKDFVHAAPGSVLLGNVTVGENTHIGAHATIMQNLVIGENVMIGANSLVTSDIRSNYLVYGCPAKEVRIWKE